MMNSLYTETFLRGIDVHEILPQQDPFIMVGCMTHFDPTVSITETVVNESNIFVDDGRLSPSGMLENIAQTCAAKIGFYNKYILHNDVQVGFIGAVRNYTVYSCPAVGSTITTRVDILEEIFGMTLASARIMYGQDTLAVAEIKLSVRNIDQHNL